MIKGNGLIKEFLKMRMNLFVVFALHFVKVGIPTLLPILSRIFRIKLVQLIRRLTSDLMMSKDCFWGFLLILIKVTLKFVNPLNYLL